MGFKRGDLLVTDASVAAIKSGETAAQLLGKLHRRGVVIYSCPGLHAKVLLLDEIAVIGSGNLSKSSHTALIEVAVITDSTAAVGGVAAFIEQLVEQTKPLDAAAITALKKIKVVRRGGRLGATPRRKPVISELGNQTWLLGVYENLKTTDAQDRWIEQSLDEVAKETAVEKEGLNWIQWGSAGRVVRDARPGDWVIQIWRKTRQSKQPVSVLKAKPLLMKKRYKGQTYLFLGEPQRGKSEVRWSAFKSFLKRLGTPAPVLNSQRVLHADLAEEINQRWKTLPATT